MPTKFVRVRDSRTGGEYSVTAAALAKDPGHLTEIKEPAADARGYALPPKPAAPAPQPVTVTEPAKTATKKES